MKMKKILLIATAGSSLVISGLAAPVGCFGDLFACFRGNRNNNNNGHPPAQPQWQPQPPIQPRPPIQPHQQQQQQPWPQQQQASNQNLNNQAPNNQQQAYAAQQPRPQWLPPPLPERQQQQAWNQNLNYPNNQQHAYAAQQPRPPIQPQWQPPQWPQQQQASNQNSNNQAPNNQPQAYAAQQPRPQQQRQPRPQQLRVQLNRRSPGMYSPRQLAHHRRVAIEIRTLPPWVLISLIVGGELLPEEIEREKMLELLLFVFPATSFQHVSNEELRNHLTLYAVDISQHVNELLPIITNDPSQIDQMDEQPLNELTINFGRDPRASLNDKRIILRDNLLVLRHLSSNNLDSVSVRDLHAVSEIVLRIPHSIMSELYSDDDLRRNLLQRFQTFRQVLGESAITNPQPIFTDQQLLSMSLEDIQKLAVRVLRRNLVHHNAVITGAAEKTDLVDLFVGIVNDKRRAAGLPALGEHRPPPAPAAKYTLEQIGKMPISELKNILQSHGISYEHFLERSELEVEVAKIKSLPAKYTLEQIRKMPISELKKALKSRGISAKHFLERSELENEMAKIESEGDGSEDEDESTCLFCGEGSPVDDPRFTCGHSCACADCSKDPNYANLKKCPFCKNNLGV